MNKKSIFIISDLHMQFSYYEEVIPNNLDLLIIAGDALGYGNSAEARIACNFFQSLIEDKKIKEIIWVLGNHDVDVTQNIDYYKSMYRNISFMIKEEFFWNDIKFFVTGYSPFVQPRWTNYFLTINEEKKVMVPLTTPDIIISHCPPSHKEFSYVTDSRVDIGSMELRKYIENNYIKFCFNGHLHLDYSTNKNEYLLINNCNCFNVSSQGQLLSVENGKIKLEQYSPSLNQDIYLKCRKNGVPYDHLNFMRFIQIWGKNIPLEQKFYKINWSASGIFFRNLTEKEVEILKEYFEENFNYRFPFGIDGGLWKFN